MWHLAKSYLRFLWHSGNQHGLHSPFVFDLVTKCFYNKENRKSYQVLSAHREALVKDSREISVEDFGSGSRVFKSNLREVNAIAKNAGISSKRAALLNRLVDYFEAEEVLEIGTSVGLATMAMAVDNHKAKITTVEGCPQTAAIATEYFSKFGINTITSEVEKFENFIKDIPLEMKYDLIYFDGNHTKEATIAYFETLLKTTHNSSVWIFDDIHWSAGMTEAWKFIKNYPEVTVTIDTFQWGFVFFRKEQVKQHFVVRA